MERVYGMFLQNGQVTVDEVAHQLQISRGSTYESIHNRHAFHKVCAWWVPKQRTELHKEKHFDICKRLLDWYGAEDDHFLEIIVTGDETWTHHYEPESKHQSTDWKLRHSPTKKKFKTHSTAGKVMLTVFGTLSRDRLNNEQCSLQCDEVKPAIRSQWRGLLSESVVLLHDNACPLTATHTVETLKKLNFEVLEHPCIVLTLPLRTHLFSPLNQALRGRRFTTDQRLDVTVPAWLVSQHKTFYS